MTMLEKIQVVPATTLHGQGEVSPELEGRLRQFEREIAQVGTEDLRKTSLSAAAARALCSTLCLQEVDFLCFRRGRGNLAGMSNPPKLLDRVRAAIRTRHYSPRTEEAHVMWVRRYIPSAMGGEEVKQRPQRLPVVLTVDEVRRRLPRNWFRGRL